MERKNLQIENELSDLLHDSLTKKFIDYSSKFFIGREKFQNIKDILVKNKNEIFLDNYKYGIIKNMIHSGKNIFTISFSISNIKKTVRKVINDKIDNLNAPLDSISFGDVAKSKITEDTHILGR